MPYQSSSILSTKSTAQWSKQNKTKPRVHPSLLGQGEKTKRQTDIIRISHAKESSEYHIFQMSICEGLDLPPVKDKSMVYLT